MRKGDRSYELRFEDLFSLVFASVRTVDVGISQSGPPSVVPRVQIPDVQIISPGAYPVRLYRELSIKSVGSFHLRLCAR